MITSRFPSSRPALAAALLAVLSFVGCACKGPGVEGNKAELRATPTALSFEACPTKDENNVTVQDVFPDTQKIVLENLGKVATGFTVTLSGKDKDAFTLGTGIPTDIGPSGSLEIPVSFAPAKKGELSAQLTFDDGVAGSTKPVVTLQGSGRDLPSQATIETGPQKTDKSGYKLCTDGSPVSDCELDFPDTLFGQANTLQLKIRNKGCPALKISGLVLEDTTGSFFIDQPTQLPSATSPLLLSTADGTEETTVTIRFAPLDDGSSADSYRFASLAILSNDPTFKDGSIAPARIQLSAQAIKPSIYATPSICDFSNTNDPCGNGTKVPNSAKFRITNDGSATVRIDSAKFLSSNSATTGTGGRFTIAAPVEGQTLAPTQSVTFDVSHLDQPLYVSDQLKIEATIMQAGQPAGPGGSITLALFGGKKPCLTTDPIDQMNFNDPAQELTAAPLKIKNGANCGTLIVNAVTIDPSNFFSLIDPLVPANAQIAPGQQLEATVQFKRPPSGGIQLGTLRVKTNDSDFAGPEYKIVQLVSQSAFDPVPIAELRACKPADLLTDPQCAAGPSSSAAVTFSAITPKEVTLSGITSYDPDPTNSAARPPATKYRFTLLPGAGGSLPPGVTTANLQSKMGAPISGQQITDAVVKLVIPAGGTGNYRIALTVYDSKSQASSNSAIMNLNVYP